MKEHVPQILLIDDSDNDVELVKIALSEQLVPCNVSVLNDGEEALTYLNGSEYCNPDLILLDLNLPKINGHEILKNLRSQEKFQTIPIIILTSSDAENDISESYTLGANAFIKKGIDPEEFKEALRNLDIYWLLKF